MQRRVCRPKNEIDMFRVWRGKQVCVDYCTCIVLFSCSTTSYFNALWKRAKRLPNEINRKLWLQLIVWLFVAFDRREICSSHLKVDCRLYKYGLIRFSINPLSKEMLAVNTVSKLTTQPLSNLVPSLLLHLWCRRGVVEYRWHPPRCSLGLASWGVAVWPFPLSKDVILPHPTNLSP